MRRTTPTTMPTTVPIGTPEREETGWMLVSEGAGIDEVFEAGGVVVSEAAITSTQDGPMRVNVSVTVDDEPSEFVVVA